jgi:hypothetical protein
MEAGIASHVWSIEEIVQLPDYKWHIGFIDENGDLKHEAE